MDGRFASPSLRDAAQDPSRAIPFYEARHARPVVAAFGEWDTGNLGDRAIHHGVLRFFAECGWDTSSYVLGSLTPARTGAVDEEVVPAGGAGKRTAPRLAPWLKRALRGVRQRYRIRQLLPQLSRVQAISVGGGATLSDANLHFPQSLAALTEAARVLDKPLLCLGCSAEGPWSAQGVRKIQEFLVACAVVAARDEATAERIATLLHRPVPIFGDFCLAEVPTLSDEHGPRLRRGIAINVYRVPLPWNVAQERYEDALVALANHLAERTAARGSQRIRIFTTNTPDDALAARRVFTRLAGAGAELHLPRSLGQLTALLRESELVIASRLHGAILGLAANAPVIGFSPAPKLAHYFSTMGLGEYSFDLDDDARLVHWLGGADYGSLAAAQRRALARSPAWAGRARVRAALGSIAGAPARAKTA